MDREKKVILRAWNTLVGRGRDTPLPLLDARLCEEKLRARGLRVPLEVAYGL